MSSSKCANEHDPSTEMKLVRPKFFKEELQFRESIAAKGNVVLKIEATGRPIVIDLIGSGIETAGGSSEGIRLQVERIHLEADALELKTGSKFLIVVQYPPDISFPAKQNEKK